MQPRVIVLDFDGTFTRVDDEAAPFLAAFRASLAELVGHSIDGDWDRAAAAIEASPDHFGWEFEGRIVAPSHADPYIFATSVGQRLLAERPDARSVLEALFQRCYPLARTVFRHDAREVVEALLDRGAPVYVVTNSMTHHVASKIEALAPRGAERLTIVGDAKKFALVDAELAPARFATLPESVSLPGLHRPVWMRRGRYYDALERIWAGAGAGPESTLVCGDIFELDLAMPAALGARVHLVARPSTRAYERDAVLAAGGSVSEHLSGLLDALA